MRAAERKREKEREHARTVRHLNSSGNYYRLTKDAEQISACVRTYNRIRARETRLCTRVHVARPDETSSLLISFSRPFCWLQRLVEANEWKSSTNNVAANVVVSIAVAVASPLRTRAHFVRLQRHIRSYRPRALATPSSCSAIEFAIEFAIESDTAKYRVHPLSSAIGTRALSRSIDILLLHLSLSLALSIFFSPAIATYTHQTRTNTPSHIYRILRASR